MTKNIFSLDCKSFVLVCIEYMCCVKCFCRKNQLQVILFWRKSLKFISLIDYGQNISVLLQITTAVIEASMRKSKIVVVTSFYLTKKRDQRNKQQIHMSIDIELC